MTDYKPHRFNPLIAKVYSLPAAIIFHYIWVRCGCGSGKFVTLTVDELAAQYPYIGRTAIWEALQLLVMPGKNPGIVSRKIVNGVYHYGIIPTDKAYDTYKFDVRVATELGIVPAIILASIGYWVKMNWKQKAEEAVRKLDPNQFTDHRSMFEEALVLTFRGAAHTTTMEDWLTRHSYTSERTVRRGFSCLLKAGFLEKRPGKQHKTIYTLSRKLLVEYADKLLSLSEMDNSAAKSECRPAKSERSPAKGECNLPGSLSKQVSCRTPVEAHDESIITQHGDAFAPPSLADARFGVARSASYGEFSPALRADLTRLNQPGYARRSKRPNQKRAYTRLPQPDDPEFDLFIDDLPSVEREKYLASLR